MSAEVAETFRNSLVGSATLYETTAAEFHQTISPLIDSPAVGTSLPFAGLSVPDSVSTEFTPTELERAVTGVTPARSAIASYGTVILASDSAGTELASLYPTKHLVVVAQSSLLPDMEAAYEKFEQDITASEATATTQVLATGPSATADMGTLVHGVHGPHDVHIVLVVDR